MEPRSPFHDGQEVKRERKELELGYFLQGRAHSDLTSFHQLPPLKGSTTQSPHSKKHYFHSISIVGPNFQPVKLLASTTLLKVPSMWPGNSRMGPSQLLQGPVSSTEITNNAFTGHSGLELASV